MDIRTLAALASARGIIKNKKKNSSSKDEEEETCPKKNRASTLETIIKTILFPILFLAYLTIQLVATLAVYIYINLVHPGLLEKLLEISNDVLQLFMVYFFQIYPDIENSAFTELFNKNGPNAILLLLLGLAMNLMIRGLAWLFAGLRKKPKASKPTEPAPAAS
jgi:hypothetical protein